MKKAPASTIGAIAPWMSGVPSRLPNVRQRRASCAGKAQDARVQTKGMAMAEPVSGLAVPAIEFVFAQAEKRGWVEKFFDLFRGKLTVLVLGSSGVGKSQFLTSLENALPRPISRWDRTIAVHKKRIKLESKIFDFKDTPGELGLLHSRTKAYLEANDGVDIIINVVAYGYHEYKGNQTEAIDSNNRPRDTWLSAHRQREIDQLSEWVPLLGSEQVARKIITVVNKADLWWDCREQVISHYENGEYAKALSDAKRLSPVVKESCSVLQQFYGYSPVSGHFDDRARADIRGHMIDAFVTACGGESRRG